MEAICKADYDRRVDAHKEATRLIEQARKNGKSTDGMTIPPIEFHDIYGVWFSGKLIEIIREIGRKRFKVDLEDRMHVYVDVNPKSIVDGVHDILVYERACCLYKWKAHSYHRGLVVLVDDEVGNARAEMFRQSGTWSWAL